MTGGSWRTEVEIIRNVRIMQQTTLEFRMQDRTVGFVPTMGALHEGHLSLIGACKEENDVTVVSIFVNPAQFGPAEDFGKYPRDFDGDLLKLEERDVDTMFFPDASDVYPEGYATYVNVKGLSERLCGLYRPGHFSGVATVVTKLLNIVRPHRAYFGQKDYQQSLIIKRLISDLNLDSEVILCPTIRENDGLAMSSRNSYLSEDERRTAAIIYETLRVAEQRVRSGNSFVEVKTSMGKTLSASPLIREIQYASVFDPDTLEDLSSSDITTFEGRVILLAVAVLIGSTRLIDNMLVDIS
jgi:pantoate--beta-alanine ligase